MTANNNAARPEQRSFLVADCGTLTTSVALFDVVGNAFRLIAQASAPTTAGAPWMDALAGIQQAIAQLSETTGRLLLTERGDLIRPAQPNGVGVDFFLATRSAGEPLTALLVALLEDVSLASVRRVLNTLYVNEVDRFSLGDSRSQQEQVDAILRHNPDLIFIAGGTDGGADQRLINLVETVDIGLSLQAPSQRPQIIFAGNGRLRERVSEILGHHATVRVAENVRPTLELEQLEDAMRVAGEVDDALCLDRLPGIDGVLAWSQFMPIPTARAFGGMMEYFAALYKGRVLGLDLGAGSVTLVEATPEQVRLAVRTDLGMGRHLRGLRNAESVEEIAGWLPEPLSTGRIHDFICNKMLQPHTVAMSREELYLEQAIARLMLRRAVQDAAADWGWNERHALVPPAKMLVLRGSTLTRAPRPGQVMAMILDALQPAGVFSVAMDNYGILPALGALAPFEPVVPVQVLEAGALVELGWVVVPLGRANRGQRVLQVIMESERGGRVAVEVPYGSLEVLPLSPGETARLRLRPLRRFDVGQGPGRERQLTIRGGALGLTIDARGRPLSLPQEPKVRQETVRRWLREVGA